MAVYREESFGPGNIILANKGIVEKVIQPMILGDDPMDRHVVWHKFYKLTRDHGQKGMSMQALSGVDIALWDIAVKVAGPPIHKQSGGKMRIPTGPGLGIEFDMDFIKRFEISRSRPGNGADLPTC